MFQHLQQPDRQLLHLQQPHRQLQYLRIVADAHQLEDPLHAIMTSLPSSLREAKIWRGSNVTVLLAMYYYVVIRHHVITCILEHFVRL